MLELNCIDDCENVSLPMVGLPSVDDVSEFALVITEVDEATVLSLLELGIRASELMLVTSTDIDDATVTMLASKVAVVLEL